MTELWSYTPTELQKDKRMPKDKGTRKKKENTTQLSNKKSRKVTKSTEALLSVQDLEKLHWRDVQRVLKSVGLSSGGKKGELIQRYEKDYLSKAIATTNVAIDANTDADPSLLDVTVEADTSDSSENSSTSQAPNSTEISKQPRKVPNKTTPASPMYVTVSRRRVICFSKKKISING